MAAGAAILAATIVDGYGSSLARSYGRLRAVVVASSPLAAGEPLDPGAVDSRLEVRRVPARFVPPGTLARPTDALGMEPLARLPTGSYLSSALLRPPPRRRPPALPGGRRPVEIRVSGLSGPAAEALSAVPRVDVVVTSEPTGPGPGRTYVAAPAVALLGLSPGPGGAAATLALTRGQALRLIAAENFARQVTLLPRPGRSVP